MLNALSAVLLLPQLAAASPARDSLPTWRIDPTHSELSFRIRHLVSKVRGTFTQWSGTITGDPSDWSRGSVTVTIQTASVSTNNERRDNDLRSANFFSVDTFPTMTFKSTKVTTDGATIRLEGDLTIRDVTKPVILKGTYLGLSPDQRGDRIGFEASTTINRLDYGVKWNRAVEGGGVLLGDDVEITIGIEAARQRSAS